MTTNKSHVGHCCQLQSCLLRQWCLKVRVLNERSSPIVEGMKSDSIYI